MGTPSLARIIPDIDLALKALEIVYRENEAAFEGLSDRNGHRRKVGGKGESVRCGGALTKGEGRECICLRLIGKTRLLDYASGIIMTKRRKV